MFARAVVKLATFDPDFELIVREVEAVYWDFLDYKEKYITFSGGVKDEK